MLKILIFVLFVVEINILIVLKELHFGSFDYIYDINVKFRNNSSDTIYWNIFFKIRNGKLLLKSKCIKNYGILS